MTSPITTVVFDIGNVLIEWNPEHLYRKLIYDEEERADFLQTVCSPEWNLQQDLGRTWNEAVKTLSKEYPEKADLIAAYSEQWHEMVPGEVPGTAEILRELKDTGCPLYAITNFSNEKFAESRERFPFLNDSFRDIVVSAEENLIKPDPEIYHVLLDRNGLEAGNCFFIDDSEKNIEAARSVGMNAHHFKDAGLLRAELVQHGLLDD
ncbi:HAD family hydrolase [Roseibium sp. SCP14]|uniref:HAD family hydrolase n=1 Tax=Roseibium sp. SCP14 TaxID=3141375 RepID=UPI00333C6CB6